MTAQLCPGSEGRWGSGTGFPICPVCHRGPRSLGAPRPARRKGKWVGTVPSHGTIAAFWQDQS